MAKAKASKTSLATSKPNEVAIPNLLDENSGTVPEFSPPLFLERSARGSMPGRTTLSGSPIYGSLSPPSRSK